jgi:hypothetical protein
VTKHVEKQEWVRIAEEFEASGLTQREFAERRAMSLGTLQSWVYRRRRQAGAVRVESIRMLPVQVAAVPAVSGTMLEVVAPSGARVRFAAGTDVEYVAHLVAALSR